MQYATMIDLLDKARQRGAIEEHANEVLHESFGLWLDDQQLGEVTEEEEGALWLAFEEGFGIK